MRGLAPLCAAGLVLAAPGAAFADTRTTTTDSVPAIPSGMTTSPAPQNPDGNACGGGTPGWIGRTTTLQDGTSNVLLSAVAPAQPGSLFTVGFHLWDTTAGESADATGGAWPTSQPIGPGNTGQAYVGRALADGHQYGWNARTTAGGVNSPATANCAFNVDLTAPTLASIAPSTVFPPTGSGAKPTGHAGDRGVTVRVTSKEQAPAGCAPGSGCLAGGVREFQYALDDTGSPTGTGRAPAVLGADGTAYADIPISVGAANWGSHRLNVRAVDAAGNSEPQWATYDYYVPARPATAPVAGDVDFDGVPDALVPAADGSLTLVRGGTGTPRPETASTAGRSPRNDSWNNYLVAHRGAVMGSGDSLFAYNKSTKQLFVYVNDANEVSNGVDGHFTGLSVQVGESSACDRGIDGTWGHITQMTAVQRGTGGTGLVTVEQGHLRYYPSSNICFIGGGVELGAAGDDWSGFTLMSPGEVNGAPTLWVRDSVTGAVTALTLPLDAAGKPVSGFTPLAAPAHKPLVWGVKSADGKDLCADIDHGWTGNGTAALLWTCADQGGSPNQQVTFGTDGSLHVLGKCLDVTGGATANGSPVNLWDCNGSPAQQWVMGPHPHTLKNPNAAKCLDADMSVGQGARLVITDCGKTASEEWTYPAARSVLPLGLAAGVFPTVDSPGDMNADGYPDLVATVFDGRLVRFAGTAPSGTQPRFAAPQEIVEQKPGHNVASAYNPGRCLDNYGASAGGSLRFHDCWNGPNQKFAFAPDGTLQTGGRCVTVQGDQTTWGTPVVIADCQAGGGQTWTYRADGTIHNPASNACLELPGWNDANGTPLGIWGCNGNANQRWTLSANTA